MIKLDLTGKRFGRWLVLGYSRHTRTKAGQSVVLWNVRCDCGKEREIRTGNLSGNKTTSCGCRNADRNRALTGDKSPTWKRGYIHDEYGYKLIRIPEHHRAKSNGYVREHIVVMEKFLGRRMLPHEQVHHKNGVKDDNRIENLELWSKSQPSGQRVKDKVEWAKEILRLYGDKEF